MRIFLDANVLFSAAKSDGPMRQLLGRLIDAGHECHVDGYVIDEARRNLVAKAPETEAVLRALLGPMNIADVHRQEPSRTPPPRCRKRISRCSPQRSEADAMPS